MNPPRAITDLPIEAAVDEVTAATNRGGFVLTAEPGAGKSSVIPLVVAEALGGADAQRVVVLQPRRLAARSVAERLAALTGTEVGGFVGVTVRGERRHSKTTRIEVMTEAVLTNRLQRDPELAGVGAIIFDEFHERNLHSDLGLAMALEVRQSLRPDLATVIMSATLAAEPVARLLGTDDVIAVPGRTHPVEVVHLTRPERRMWPTATADAAMAALRATDGDVLVFVPGRREIDDVIGALRAEARIGADNGGRPGGTDVVGLHGGSGAEVQRGLLRRDDGRRRVIVATSVAETSVTLPGVTAVVDGGLARRARFDPETGLGRLETRHVTRFSADQRRGRAGRLAPGMCFRLWSSEDHRHLDDAVPPEITDGDPLPLAFELARWGDPDATSLPLLDHPGIDRLMAARRLLGRLGLVDDDGRTTRFGDRAAGLGVHPRLGALLLTAPPAQRPLAALAAAALDDDRWATTTDFGVELGDTGRRRQLRRGADRLLTRLDRGDDKPGGRARTTARAGDRSGGAVDVGELGRLLAAAWPDRIAMRRGDQPGRYLLANGREAGLRPGDPLAGTELLVVVEGDGERRQAMIRRAVGVDRAIVLDAAASFVAWHDHVAWDERSDSIVAQRRQQLGAIVLHRQPLPTPPADAVADALRHGIARRGLDALRWNDDAVALRARLRWLHEEAPDEWPAVDDETLLARLDEWLDVSACRTPADVRRIRVGPALLNLLDWRLRTALDELAPAALAVPRGALVPVDYRSGRPVWAVRLQRLIGLDQHPQLGPNRSPITIELLSPANRPAQVTTDLPGFWRGSYAAVRAELRGRYPKHDWPERPWER